MITTSQEEDDFMAPQTFISGIRNSLEHNCFDYDHGNHCLSRRKHLVCTFAKLRAMSLKKDNACHK
jgi:hypothetical protein